MVAHIILLISLQTLMSVLRILTTAVGIMPLVQIQRDCSTAFDEPNYDLRLSI